MKQIKYSILIAGLLSIIFVSCSDWLDVPVEGRSTSGELFETGDGYRSALHGLYKNMVTDDLYGANLQFGLVDFFSNQYSLNVPTADLNSTVLIAAGKREYNNKDLRPQLDQLWLKAFNVIASANNLIQNIEGESNDKFSQGEIEKNTILGEAKAVRAFLHFDMLRLFAPAPVNDDSRVYIPYITDFPNTQAPQITVKETMGKIIADLEEARALVKTFDETPLGLSASVSGNARFYNELSYGMEGAADKSKVDEFFLGRGYRFSYWAVTALLARVYQYNGTYDPTSLDKAKAYAEEILNATFSGAQSTTYSPFKDENFAFSWDEQPEQMRDIRMVGNLIMGLYRDNEMENKLSTLEAQFPRVKQSPAQYNLCVINKNGQDIFKTTGGVDESETDIRAKRLIYEPSGSYGNPLSTKWYIKEKDTKERDRTINIFPLLRTSEMRYIIAECEARKNNFAGAYEILNTMREKRGLREYKLPVQNSFDGFVKDLVREGQREWISEGQLFYLYKRLNAGVKRDNGTVVPFTNAESVLPIPIDETR